MEIINLVLLDLPDTIPCHTTVKNWVEKAGFDVYKNRGKKLNELYALILDESVTVGDQKMLLQLQVPAAHSGRSLTHPDVEVVGMDVSESWVSDKVREKVEESSEYIGGIRSMSSATMAPICARQFVKPVFSFVLTIPLYTKVSSLELAEVFEVKERMERVKVKEVKEWAKGALGNNWVAKRTQKLSAFS